MMADPLLTTLADGDWHSGEALAAAAGVSRAAVHKRVDHLRAAGWNIDAAAGRGYQLPGGADLLDADALAANTPADWQLTVLDSVPGTNAWLGERDYAGPHCVIAETQTAGRGRRGRAWHSPPGANLYCSLDWQFDLPPAALSALGLMVAVSLAEVIGHPDVRIKWPNDLLVDDAKLAGTLIEARGEMSGPVRTIIGIGCNVGMTAADDADIDQAWTSLSALGVELTRTTLAIRLMQRLAEDLPTFAASGFPAFQEAFAARDALSGQSVRVVQGRKRKSGIADGVDRDGALRLRRESGVARIGFGEVSVRRR